MKKTISLLLLTVMLLGSIPAFAAAPAISSISCTAREDGLNDVSVVVKADALYTELTLLVLGSDDNGISPEITIGDSKTGYAYYIAQGNTGATTSYTFNFTMDIPETMIDDVADYIYVFSGNSSDYVTSQIAEFNYDVTFSIGTNGSVKIGDVVITDGASKTVSSGTNLALTVTPDDGYRVKTATIGSIDMVDNGEGVYRTGSIGADRTITVEFEEDVTEPSLSAHSTPRYEDSKTSVVFATLVNGNENYTLVTYGMVAGKTEDVKLEDADGETCFDLEKKVNANEKGQYGIRIIDTEANYYLGSSYYVVPYAIYNNGIEDVTYYGRPVLVNFNDAE